jgi:hypothetical protein
MRRINSKTITLNLPTLRLEGGLFLPDQLEKAALGKASLQTEADYQIPTGLKLKDEYSRAFQIASAQWKHFAALLERQDLATDTITQKFVQDLLRDALGYQDFNQVNGWTIEDRHYPISAILAQTVPLIIAPHTLGLDEADTRFAVIGGGAKKKTAFQLAQEFLNASEQHTWGLVSNGKQIRLLRNAATLTRPSFLEFDLQDMLSGLRFAEFEMVWRLLHASRAKADIWEHWRTESQQAGTRVREGLRQGVTDALLTLGTGFIQHPANDALRLALHEGRLNKEAYFQQLLRLVYRFIFLFTVEERGLLHAETDSAPARKIYAEGYALARLRERCLKRRARDNFDDLWQSIRIVFKGLAKGQPLLALPALGGLFAEKQCHDLDTASLSNAFLLEAIKQLRWSNLSGSLAAVDYRNMGSEELGSVYESLLELVPEIDIAARQFGFIGFSRSASFACSASEACTPATKGNARKTTGSYYTPDSLVQELIKSALEPVINQRLAQNPSNPIAALLSVNVIDPACGSGHFLLAAARRLAEQLAGLRATDGAVKPEDYRHALREVVSHCIFGVDKNPMAIELARMALWLESYEQGLPLSFLDHHLQCGDALIGLTDFKQLENGIAKEAFKALSGDDKEICKQLSKVNQQGLKAFKKLQDSQNLDTYFEDGAGLTEFQTLETMPDNTPDEQLAKEQAYLSFLNHAKHSRLGNAADLFIGAFLLPKTDKDALSRVPTSENLYFELFTGQAAADLSAVQQEQRLQAAQQVCSEARVFHWQLAFPQVFAQGGFDCVLANPPWERIKLQEEEFFATRNQWVAEAKNKAERSQRIAWLAQGVLTQQLYPDWQQAVHECQAEQDLYQAFISARRSAEAASVFAHINEQDGGRFALTGVGDVNTYALFAETISQITAPHGRAGFIVPTGIATDDSTKAYFGQVAQSGKLASLYDFENREKVFAAVDSRMKFCLLTLGQAEQAEFAFFLGNTEQLKDQNRRFRLTAEDFIRINPNTLTCPVFRSKQDAELTRKIYQRVPVLIKEARGAIAEQNPWGISFMRMFDMSNDSHLFHDSPAPDRLPLYEAKMIHQFDHRWASYQADGDANDVNLTDKQNPQFSVMPRYWLDKSEVEERLNDKNWQNEWLLGFRDITNATNERTVISSVMPKVGVGNKAPLIIVNADISVIKIAALIGNLSALCFDFTARQKIGGTTLNYFLFKQLPILPPDFYTETDLNFIVPRVLELTYTAHDLKSWADDVGATLVAQGRINPPRQPYPFNPERRAKLRAELDAWYAKAYGLSRDELRYILDPADIMGNDYPSETFRVLKNNELKQFGEYRTRRLVLEAWDKLERNEL